MKKRLVFSFWPLFVLLFSSEKSLAGELLPDVSLEVTYQQRSEGKLSEGVHRVHLLCYRDSCTLTTLTLNQCWEVSEGERRMFPKVEQESTNEGTLTVRAAKGALIAEVKGPDLTMTHRFEYNLNEKNIMFTKLIGFSGAVVKESDILKKVITWEMVPLKGTFVQIKPACDMMLAGVPE